MAISIAIDGPAGAGKSTIAKLLADKYSLMYINTGAMYRAVTLNAMGKNIKPDDIDELVKLMNSLDMYFRHENLIVNDKDVTDKIYMPEISKNVSYYSTVKEVREKLVMLQREMAKKYPVIMDGRDIGTVVLKDAKLKIFLTASAETRADRRYKELLDKGIQVNYDDILKDIKKRDHIDSTREISPLIKAQDAIELDSSGLNINEVVDRISNYIESIK